MLRQTKFNHTFQSKMSRVIHFPKVERKSILDLHKKNCSHRKIGNKINRPKTVVTNFLKDPLKYGLGKRTGHRRKVDECIKWHVLTAASDKISCSNIIHNLNLKMSR